MIYGLVQILLFQSLGELVSKFLLPTLPGPVIGLVLLVIWLVIRKGINAELAMVAEVVLFLPQLKANALAIITALIGSIILTIGSSAVVVRLLSKKASDE